MKPALFSVSYAGLWGQSTRTLDEFVQFAGQAGYASVMIAGKRPHLSPLDTSPARLSRLREQLQAAQVTCDVVAAYTNFAPAVKQAGEVPYLEMQIAYVESLASIASQLGASIIRVFTAYETDGLDLQSLWKRVVSAIRECCDRVQPSGLTLAVQNHHDLGLPTEALLDLIREIDRPNCKLGFDAWSPALRGEDLYSAALQAAPYAVLTTNADYVHLPRHHYCPELVNYQRVWPDWVRAVPFGTGFIDYDAFFSGLSEGGFKGIAAYEICSPIRGGGELPNLDACASRYLAWMRERNFV